MLMRFCLLAVVLLSGGCDQQPAAQAAQPLAPQTATVVVDSILPVAEEIRRFKAQFACELPAELERVAESRTALVAAFRDALIARDTARLESLTINAAEFIELYYPHTQYTRPPYRQSPALVWFFIRQSSEKGLTRALARFGSTSMTAGDLSCDQPVIQEQNRLWTCTMPVELDGHTAPIRLFGAILERHGRFKFVSFANDF